MEDDYLSVFSAQRQRDQLGIDGTLPSFPPIEGLFLSNDNMTNHRFRLPDLGMMYFPRTLEVAF